MVSIILNGEERNVEAQSIAELLSALNLTDKKIAVERNQQIVTRTNFMLEPLTDGDRIEIIHFVGGG